MASGKTVRSRLFSAASHMQKRVLLHKSLSLSSVRYSQALIGSMLTATVSICCGENYGFSTQIGVNYIFVQGAEDASQKLYLQSSLQKPRLRNESGPSEDISGRLEKR